MSTYIDDFNRAAFERALPKFNRCQYDALDTDAWVALVEGYRAQVDALQAQAEWEAAPDEFPDDFHG